MKKFKVLAGPCVIENEKMTMQLAEGLKRITDKYDVDFYFKASFDKANRTSLSSFRGPGIDIGLKVLEKVKKEYEVKIVTDIHESYQAEAAAQVADIIQIPAFLCRQTDLLTAAAKTGKMINVKKAQFMAPWDMPNVVKKIEASGNKNIMLSERGTSFGYHTLIVDMTSLIEMKKIGYPIVFDATHSVQKPGGNGASSGGNSSYVRYLARAAAAVGIDGLFTEVHPNPAEALSDGANCLRLDDYEEVLYEVLQFHALKEQISEGNRTE